MDEEDEQLGDVLSPESTPALSPLCVFFFSHPYSVGGVEDVVAPPEGTYHLYPHSLEKELVRRDQEEQRRRLEQLTASGRTPHRGVWRRKLREPPRDLRSLLLADRRGCGELDLQDILRTIKEAWAPCRSFSLDRHLSASRQADLWEREMGTGGRLVRGSRSKPTLIGLPRRRYSVPEAVMRRYTLTKQSGDSSSNSNSDSGAATVPALSPEALSSGGGKRKSPPTPPSRQPGWRGGGRGGSNDGGSRFKPMDRGPPMYKGGRSDGGRRGPHPENSLYNRMRGHRNTSREDDVLKEVAENGDPQLIVPNTSPAENIKDGSDSDADDLVHAGPDCIQCKEFLFGSASKPSVSDSPTVKPSHTTSHVEELIVSSVSPVLVGGEASEIGINGVPKTETPERASPIHVEETEPNVDQELEEEEEKRNDASSPGSVESRGSTKLPLEEIPDGYGQIETQSERNPSPETVVSPSQEIVMEIVKEVAEHDNESPVQASSAGSAARTSSLEKVSDRSSLSPPDSDLQTSSSSVPTRQSDSSTQSPVTYVDTSSGYSDQTPGNLSTPDDVHSTSDPEKYAESASCSITPLETSSSSGRGRTPDRQSLESSKMAGRVSSPTSHQPSTDTPSTQDSTVSVPSDSAAFSELTPSTPEPTPHTENVKMESKMTQYDVTEEPVIEKQFDATSIPKSPPASPVDTPITDTVVETPEPNELLSGINIAEADPSIEADLKVPSDEERVTPNKSEPDIQQDDLENEELPRFCGTELSSLPLALDPESLPKDVEIINQTKNPVRVRRSIKPSSSESKSTTTSESTPSKPLSEPMTKPTTVTPNRSALEFSPTESFVDPTSGHSEVYSWSNRFDEDQYMKLTHQRQRYWMNRKMVSDVVLPATPPHGELSACVGAGTTYRKTNYDVQLVVPRYSALPRSISMLVNTSSTECSSLSSDSDCLSLVDSLEDVRMLTPKHVHTPSTADVVRLLPEGAGAQKPQERVNVATPRGKAKAFFVPMEETQGEKQPRPVKSASQSMPDKLKERLAQRHKQIELRRQMKIASQDSKEKLNDRNKGRNIRTRRGPNGRVQTKVAELRKSPKEKVDLTNNKESILRKTNIIEKPDQTKMKESNVKKTVPPQKVASKPKPETTRREPVPVQKAIVTPNDALPQKDEEVFSKPPVRSSTPMEEGVKYRIELGDQKKQATSPVKEELLSPTNNADTLGTQTIKPQTQKSSIPVFLPQTEQQKLHALPPYNTGGASHQGPTNKPSYLPVRQRQSPPTKRSANLLGNRFQQRFEVIPEERSGSLESSMEDPGRHLDKAKTTALHTSVKDGGGGAGKETNLVKQDTVAVIHDGAPKNEGKPLGNVGNGVTKRLVRPTRSVRSTTKPIRPERQVVEEPIREVHKGRESLAPPTDDEMSSLSKGWINFYMLNGGNSSPENQGDEVSILKLPNDAKNQTCCKNSGQPLKTVNVVGGKGNRTKQYTVFSQQTPDDAPTVPTLPELTTPTTRSSRHSPRERDESQSADSNTITAVLKFPSPRLAPAHSFEGSDSIEYSDSSSVTSSSESDSERALSPALLPVHWPIRQQQRRLPPHQRSKVYQHRSDYSQMSRQNSENNSVGWTVTVAGGNNNTQPPDLEMRLSFPACVRRAPNSQSDSGLGEDNNNNNNQRGDNRVRRQQQQQQHFLPPATPAQGSQRWTLTVKTAVGSERPQELLKAERRLFEVLPELTGQQGQSRNPKAIKVGRSGSGSDGNLKKKYSPAVSRKKRDR